MSVPDNAFQELAQIFTNRDNQIFEIEILPPPVGPLLQDGCSIGITKKYLVQAFVLARRTFFANSTSVIEFESSPTRSPKALGLDKKFQDVSVSSEIILLFDSEHLSACNWRKRYLQALVQCCDPDNPTSRETRLTVLERELTLTTTYVCSPLRRHTKSPTLWEHRLWVLKHLLAAQISGSRSNQSQAPAHEPPAAIEFVLQLLKEELAIVLRAGELHPRNYYAFSYIREAYGVLAGSVEEVDGGSSQLARSLIDPTLDWCLAHTTDISGWMFVLHLLEAIPDPAARTDTVRKAVHFARDIGWEGESLWAFVDLAAQAFDLLWLVKDALRIQPPRDVGEPHHVLHAGHGEKTPQLGIGWKGCLAMARAYWAGNR